MKFIYDIPFKEKIYQNVKTYTEIINKNNNSIMYFYKINHKKRSNFELGFCVLRALSFIQNDLEYVNDDFNTKEIILTKQIKGFPFYIDIENEITFELTKFLKKEIDSKGKFKFNNRLIQEFSIYPVDTKEHICEINIKLNII